MSRTDPHVEMEVEPGTEHPARPRGTHSLRLRAMADLVRRRAAHPRAVLVLPGLGTNDVSTLPLRGYLSRVGHRVGGWQLGVQRFPVAAAVRSFIPKLESFAEAAAEPITLVGWSLGGVVARETARSRPELVAHVITLGSPLHLPPISLRQLRVPVTSIYSKQDRVVRWEHSIDRTTPGAVNVEVRSSHAGLGLDPAVWRVVADAIDRRGGGPDSNG